MSKKQTTKADSAQGVDTAKPESVSIQTVRDYLNKDLSVAISCLDAIQSDPDLLTAIATFMHGRMLNAQNRKIAEEALKQKQA